MLAPVELVFIGIEGDHHFSSYPQKLRNQSSANKIKLAEVGGFAPPQGITSLIEWPSTNAMWHRSLTYLPVRTSYRNHFLNSAMQRFPTPLKGRCIKKCIALEAALGKTPEERKQLREYAKEFYKLRSRLVHGKQTVLNPQEHIIEARGGEILEAVFNAARAA